MCVVNVPVFVGVCVVSVPVFVGACVCSRCTCVCRCLGICVCVCMHVYYNSLSGQEFVLCKYFSYDY